MSDVKMLSIKKQIFSSLSEIVYLLKTCYNDTDKSEFRKEREMYVVLVVYICL